MCHEWEVFPTCSPEIATTREVKPFGRTIPLESASNPSNDPYGPSPGSAAFAVVISTVESTPTPAAPMRPFLKNVRRSIFLQ